MRWPAFGAKACQGATGFRHRTVSWALGIVPANNPQLCHVRPAFEPTVQLLRAWEPWLKTYVGNDAHKAGMEKVSRVLPMWQSVRDALPIVQSSLRFYHP